MECILQNICCASGHQRKLLLLSHSVVSDSLRPHGLQYARFPCPNLSPRICLNSCPLSLWCHLTILSSVIPFCLPAFPASGSLPMSQLFASSGQSIGASASASVLPKNIQGWFPLGLTGLISLQSKGLSTVFCSKTSNQRKKSDLFWKKFLTAPWWISLGFYKKSTLISIISFSSTNIIQFVFLFILQTWLVK